MTIADRVLPSIPESVARRLHQALAHDDAFAMSGERAWPRVSLEHRGSRFLELEKQGILIAVTNSATAQNVPTLPTPTTLIAMSQYSNRSNNTR